MTSKDKMKQEMDTYSIVCQLLNELEDDLQLDLKKGENGYKSYEESYNAVKKYTLKKLKTMERRMRLKRLK